MLSFFFLLLLLPPRTAFICSKHRCPVFCPKCHSCVYLLVFLSPQKSTKSKLFWVPKQVFRHKRRWRKWLPHPHLPHCFHGASSPHPLTDKRLSASFSLAFPPLCFALGHNVLRLHVRLDVGFPHRVLEVQVQGALAGHTAVTVAATRLAVGQPVVGCARVPPGLPTQTLLLHQQLQALHLAARRPVLRLTHTLACRTTKKGKEGEKEREMERGREKTSVKEPDSSWAIKASSILSWVFHFSEWPAVKQFSYCCDKVVGGLVELWKEWASVWAEEWGERTAQGNTGPQLSLLCVIWGQMQDK